MNEKYTIKFYIQKYNIKSHPSYMCMFPPFFLRKLWCLIYIGESFVNKIKFRCKNTMNIQQYSYRNSVVYDFYGFYRRFLSFLKQDKEKHLNN